MSASSEGVDNVAGTIFELLSEPGNLPKEYLGTERQTVMLVSIVLL